MESAKLKYRTRRLPELIKSTYSVYCIHIVKIRFLLILVSWAEGIILLSGV